IRFPHRGPADACRQQRQGIQGTAAALPRTGVPVLRPLLLEFPGAAADKHPLDLDTGNEFLFGAELLVAPAPFPEKPDAYAVKFPPGDWYDYRYGECLHQKTATVSFHTHA